MIDDEARERIDALEGRMIAIESTMVERMTRVERVLGEPSSRFPARPATGLVAAAEQLLAIEAAKAAEKERRDALEAVARAAREARNAKLKTISSVLGILVVGGGITGGLVRFLLGMKGVQLP